MAGYIPAGVRSATAVDGKSDFTDQNLYSSIVLQDGGSGSQKLFTVPQGQQIPALKGPTVLATPNAWQQTHTKLTTIIEKAGELGKGIGDAALRGVSCHLEQAKIGLVAAAADTNWPGALTTAATYGATEYELSDVLSKCSLEVRVSKKPLFTSPIFALPTMGGMFGSMAQSGTSTTNAFNNSISTIGQPGLIRRLRSHIPVERADTLEAEVEVAGNSVLAFRATGGAANAGAPSLFYVIFPATIRGDVR